MTTTSLTIDTGWGGKALPADEVDLTITIDAAALGRHIAEMGSPEQAQIILGFFEQVDDAQLAYIGSERAFDNADRTDVATVLRTLADFIESPGARS